MVEQQTAKDTRLQGIAELAVRGFSALGSYLLGSGVLVLLGLNPLPSSPFAALLQNRWLGGVVVALVLAGLVLAAVVGARRNGRAAMPGGTAPLRLARFLASILVQTLAGAVLGIVFGFNSLPSSVPIIALLRTRPPLALAIIVVSLLLVIFSPLLSIGAPSAGPAGAESSKRVLAATGISLMSTALFVGLLSLVVIRPSWCPAAICPAPQRILVTHPDGVHDSNLELYFTAVQSSAYALPADPQQQSTKVTPSVSAALVDPSFPAYRAVVGVHSLQQGTVFGLVVEQVALVVDDASPAPQPLSAWVQGAPRDYHSEPFLATYHGEHAGGLLSATYVPVPTGHVQLVPGESDELDIQVSAKVATSLRFRVQVTYRVANEGTLHVLTLPHPFAVTFATADSWRPFMVSGGGFIPCAKPTC